MDGTLSKESLKPFAQPHQFLAGLDTNLASIIIAAAADIAIIVDGAGTICDVASSNDLRCIDASNRWVGMPLTACVTPESVAKIETLLTEGRNQKLIGWRQVNHPIIGRRIASETAYEVITQVPSKGATPKVPAIWGIETFTIVLSKRFMKAPVQRQSISMTLSFLSILISPHFFFI